MKTTIGIKSEVLVDLHELDPRYKINTEFILKDKWKEKGGSHYCGRIYFSRENYSTKISEKDFIKLVHGDNEIFSMGIERLLENPVDFKKMDPDYFEFIINQIK